MLSVKLFKRKSGLLIVGLFAAFALTACSEGKRISDTDMDSTGTESTNTESGGTESAGVDSSGNVVVDENGDLVIENVFTILDGNVFEENMPGERYVRFTINNYEMNDQQEWLDTYGSANQTVDSDKTYDYYLTFSITIENVENRGEDTALMNDFSIRLVPSGEDGTKEAAEEIICDAAWFDLGGVSNADAKGYFEYTLPEEGESMEVTLSYGFSEEVLALLEEGWTVYLTNDLMLERMEVEVGVDE